MNHEGSIIKDFQADQSKLPCAGEYRLFDTFVKFPLENSTEHSEIKKLFIATHKSLQSSLETPTKRDLLLCWQLAGTCLFLIRCVTCFKKNSLTYRCDNNAAFDYSGELELTWLVTQCVHGVILVAALQKVPAFPGYKKASTTSFCRFYHWL
ncbi:hypothetical protein ACROYT_G019773 [Oculina patagonica]